MFTNLHQKCSNQAHLREPTPPKEASAVSGMWLPQFPLTRNRAWGEIHKALTRQDLKCVPPLEPAHVFAISSSPPWQEEGPALLPATISSLPKQGPLTQWRPLPMGASFQSSSLQEMKWRGAAGSVSCAPSRIVATWLSCWMFLCGLMEASDNNMCLSDGDNKKTHTSVSTTGNKSVIQKPSKQACLPRMWKKAFSNLKTGDWQSSKHQCSATRPQTRADAVGGMRQQLGTGWGPTPTPGYSRGGVRPFKLTLQTRSPLSYLLDSGMETWNRKQVSLRNHPLEDLESCHGPGLFTEISTRISRLSPGGEKWGSEETAQSPRLGPTSQEMGPPITWHIFL